MFYLAHRTEDGREQALAAHCRQTAACAASFAAHFHAESAGWLAGLLHDMGKYSDAFQAYIRGRSTAKTDHSTAGCQQAQRLGCIPAAFCIAGHHAGLPDGGSQNGSCAGDGTLLGRLRQNTADASAALTELAGALPEQPAALPPLRALGHSAFQQAFFTRMLYSCLVDADFLDTEAFMCPDAAPRGQFDDLDVLAVRLEAHLAKFPPADSAVNRHRAGILAQCRAAAQDKPGLYTLTVPTGGGKTLSSMAFAMDHARKYGKRRIVYVIPYTSIIEQTADIFRGIFGAANVLEHHAGMDYDKRFPQGKNPDDNELPARMRLAAENWDAPIVVTTNVQFFESLFACRTSRCRKLHNLADSVILFDEVQMLPMPYLLPCVQAIAELTANYGVTAVLCTATQPALTPYFPLPLREIISDPAALSCALRRTTLQMDGRTDLDVLAQQLTAHPCVLCIVNSRRKAHALYTRCQGEGTYHLSTLMTPRHRRAVLAEIRVRLDNRQPCRVIATSLIEAGVDVDFPVVYREISGLDSVLQAAGRCNRAGKALAADSIVHVFELPGALPYAIDRAAGMLRETAQVYADLDTLDAVRDYFGRLYSVADRELDAKGILDAFDFGWKGCQFPFRQVAKEFRLIENDSCSIFIPDPHDAACIQLAGQLRAGERSRALMRQAAPHLVSVYPGHYEALAGRGALCPLADGLALLEERSLYDAKTGLQLEIEQGDVLCI